MDVHSGRPTPGGSSRHALDARLCTTQPTVRLNNVPGQNHSARVRFATTAQTEGSVMRTRPADSADYVVVGAGSAGSIVASRLAASCASVVVLEAGGTDRRPPRRGDGHRQGIHLSPGELVVSVHSRLQQERIHRHFRPGTHLPPTLGPSRTEPVDRSRCPGARIVAGQAVVLCAGGAIGTPAILLRSGVGPLWVSRRRTGRRGELPRSPRRPRHLAIQGADVKHPRTARAACRGHRESERRQRFREPTLPSGNTKAPTMMLAHRGAEVLSWSA